jgi:hypothetical protein
MQSCVTDVFEKASGCDLADTDCFCKAGTPDSDTISTFKDGLTSCIRGSNCTASETQQLANLDVNSVMSQANDVCSGAVTVSANVALAAGAMAFAFFF